jgi:hypothetical protein
MVVLLLPGATGCSAGAEEERTRIAAIVESLQRAFARGRLDMVCAALTDDAKRFIGSVAHGEPSRCRRDLDQFYDGVGLAANVSGGDPRVPTVEGVEAEDGVAVATLRHPAGPQIDVRLVDERGEWRVDGLYGAVLSDMQSGRDVRDAGRVLNHQGDETR